MKELKLVTPEFKQAQIQAKKGSENKLLRAFSQRINIQLRDAEYRVGVGYEVLVRLDEIPLIQGIDRRSRLSSVVQVFESVGWKTTITATFDSDKKINVFIIHFSQKLKSIND